MNTRWLAIFFLTIAISLPWNSQSSAGDTSADDRAQRYCIGLIWCVDRSAGGVSTYGLLWLYSSEERGNYSRMAIRPFYAVEEDPTKNLLRRSILWPLGSYERTGNHIWSHIVPLYWHSERPGREWTFIAPLYYASTTGDVSWQHLFPLISRQRIGEYFTRNFILGPVFISTSDTRRSLLEWDLLFPLLHHRADRDSSHTRVAPIYWSGEDRTDGTSYQYVLLLYGSSESPAQQYRFLFPVFGSDTNNKTRTSRLTLLGFPPLKDAYQLPSLSLFESATSPDGFSHRVFPIYRYASGTDDSVTLDALLLYRHHSSPSGSTDRLFPIYLYETDTAAQTHEFDLLGYRAASWFRYQDSPSSTQHRLLGLYSYEQGQDDFLQVSLVGHRRASLYLHRSQEDLTEDRLFPVHDYVRHGDSRSLSLFGISELALYRQESSPALFRHRLFPLYRYSHDQVTDETEFDALLLYRHLSGPTRVVDRLLPLWDYGSAANGEVWNLSLLGMDALALYHHRKTEQGTRDHLLPIYGYRTYEDGTSRLSVLGLPPITNEPALALFERTSSPTMIRERLFPMYQRSYDDETETTTINVAGWEPASLFRYHATPTTHSHRLLPMYGYHHDPDRTELWAVGLPSMGKLPPLSLYHASTTPLMESNRLFPLYRYRKDLQEEERSLMLFWLFWQTSSPEQSRTSFFPIGSMASDRTGGWEFSLIGLDPAAPVSWLRHSHGPDHAKAFFAPFYDYQREGDRVTLSVAGISQLALYRSETTATDHRHRIFPLYRYHLDRTQDASSLNVLLAYQQNWSPEHARYALFPLGQYEHRIDRDESRFNAVGFGRFSLYEHYKEQSRTSDRLFPLYRYTSHQETGETAFSLLWPLIDYKSKHGTVTSASLLWWLISYDHPNETLFSYQIFGLPKMAMIRRVVSPEESVFEINPVFPLYRYRSFPDGATSWDLFYGFIGVDSTREETRLKLLWMSL